MRQRTGGRARHGVAEASGAALGNHHAVRARSQGRSNDGAQVVRIFHAVEQDDETDLAAGLNRGCEDILQRGSGARSGYRDNPLVIFRIGQAVELIAVFEAHGNSLFARELNDFFDARVLAALGDGDAVDGALGFECFFDRVDAGELVHGMHSVTSKTKSGKESEERPA